MNIDERNMNWIIYRLKKQISMKAIWIFFFFVSKCVKCLLSPVSLWKEDMDVLARRKKWTIPANLLKWGRRIGIEGRPMASQNVAMRNFTVVNEFTQHLWNVTLNSFETLWGFFEDSLTFYGATGRFFEDSFRSETILCDCCGFDGNSLEILWRFTEQLKDFSGSMEILWGFFQVWNDSVWSLQVFVAIFSRFFDVLRRNWKIFQVCKDSVRCLQDFMAIFFDIIWNSLTFCRETVRIFRFYGFDLRIFEDLFGLKRFCVIIAGFHTNNFEILWRFFEIWGDSLRFFRMF